MNTQWQLHKLDDSKKKQRFVESPILLVNLYK